ncbi:MAG: stage II sporulation protein M [Theionarchaea archaeon]|nr:stage II sporulation protein M [Theionarchaea archaeon]MBU7036966.1 stage II sporulation protein M [Theionarchaea archaeon]
MNYEEFISSREGRWEELDQLSSHIKRKGYSSLSRDDLDSFLRLYRQGCADLAYVRTYYPHSRAEEYLNNLVARSHSQFARTRQASSIRIKQFFTTTFPGLFASNAKFVGLAFLVFMATMALTYVGWQVDKQFFAGLSPIPLDILEERASRGSAGPNMNMFVAPIATSSIFANNTQVGIATYGSGILLGLGTIFYLVINGLMMGVVTAFFVEHGLGISLAANILPHGILELTAIFICGGAGLKLGNAVLNPGQLSRSESISTAGKEATQLVAGAIILLIIAGIIEGYFSFVESISNEVKLMFCIIPAGFLWFYLLRHVRIRQ